MTLDLLLRGRPAVEELFYKRWRELVASDKQMVCRRIDYLFFHHGSPSSLSLTFLWLLPPLLQNIPFLNRCSLATTMPRHRRLFPVASYVDLSGAFQNGLGYFTRACPLLVGSAETLFNRHFFALR
jgi:hypothetical protein